MRPPQKPNKKPHKQKQLEDARLCTAPLAIAVPTAQIREENEAAPLETRGLAGADRGGCSVALGFRLATLLLRPQEKLLRTGSKDENIQ